MLKPTALEVNTNLNLAYVADTGNNRVDMWNLTTKHIVATFSGPVDGLSVLQPRGLALDPTGTWLYIADAQNKRIVRVSAADLTTNPEFVTSGADTPRGAFKDPQWMQFNGFDGRLYVSDLSDHIFAFTITG
jgi:DNA-binding beta-propeller fold protein YncE